MKDLLTPILNCQTTKINYISLAFKISYPTHPLFCQSDFLWNDRSSATYPFQLMARMTLGLRPSKILMSSHFGPLEVSSLQSTGSDDTCPSGLDDSYLLQLFETFAMLAPLFSQSQSVSGWPWPQSDGSRVSTWPQVGAYLPPLGSL
jgi:hypothetical protein